MAITSFDEMEMMSAL